MERLKRNRSKAQFYRQFFTYCAIRHCDLPAQEVHHIVPRAKNGKDQFINFICLCHDHHRNYKRHSRWREYQEELLIHKFYSELELFGFTSDMPEEAFRQKIAPWRAEHELSYPNPTFRQKPHRSENKRAKPHNYGLLKMDTDSSPRFCKNCGAETVWRSYCSYECAEEYMAKKNWLPRIYKLSEQQIAEVHPTTLFYLRRFLEKYGPTITDGKKRIRVIVEDVR
jgi:hypothetical protein